MSNVSDYLKWRGDLDFSQAPFNDVDNLILAQIAYVDMAGIVPVPGSVESITLAEASDTFFDIHDEKEIKRCKSFIGKAPFLMREAAATKRFGSLVLTNYVDYVDGGKEEQFSAFHIRIDNRTTYIAFRGTDDTLVGWKEDFNMSFISPVPSQKDAVKYVDTTIERPEGKLIFGGHSKGGNLAVYAAVFARPSIKKRIIAVYNNDGPGFDSEFVKKDDYIAILPKIKSIVPYGSVVGMLLNHGEDYDVVKSNQTGVMQHDSMSWQVIGPEFEKMEDLSPRSRKLNKALSAWIEGLSYEQRAEFVDTLFALVSASGAKNLSEISTAKFKSINTVLKSFRALDRTERTMILKILASLTGEIGRAYKGE